MRLMAAGIEVQTPDGRFVRFIESDPRRPKEYEEFRRIAAHLQWLNDNRQLFVRPLVFEETLIADSKNIPRAEDINNGFNMGLRWRQKSNGNYELTRLKGGRVVVTNFDPMALTDSNDSSSTKSQRRTRVDLSILDVGQMDRCSLRRVDCGHVSVLLSSPEVFASPKVRQSAYSLRDGNRAWQR
jgi:hypothetical protein